MSEKKKELITIKTFNVNPTVRLDASEFIKLVEESKEKIIFRDENQFFIVLKGIIFSSHHFEKYETFSELVSYYNDLLKMEIDKSESITIAIMLKAEVSNLLKSFLESNFIDPEINNYEKPYWRSFQSNNLERLKLYIDASQNGFNDYNNYITALDYGIPTKKELNAFMKSPFYERRGYYYPKDYQDFVVYRSGGFPTLDDFEEAEDYEFTNYDDFKNFRLSECRSKGEYEKHFKTIFQIPSLSEEERRKHVAMIRDYRKAFKNQNYGEFFRLRYIFIEKIVEHLYKTIIKQPVDSDTKIEDLVRLITDFYKKPFDDYEKLSYWRKERNKYSHEHYVINETKAEESEQFFNEFIKNLVLITGTKVS